MLPAVSVGPAHARVPQGPEPAAPGRRRLGRAALTSRRRAGACPHRPRRSRLEPLRASCLARSLRAVPPAPEPGPASDLQHWRGHAGWRVSPPTRGWNTRAWRWPSRIPSGTGSPAFDNTLLPKRALSPVSGIAGIIHFDGAPVEPGLVERMTSAMSHRGPDGIRHWIQGSVALGQCMLRTTPESLEEQQPLTNEDESLVLVMDGRVDNWEELRKELLARGAVLRNRSDAELVLRSYRTVGTRVSGPCRRRLRPGDLGRAAADGLLRARPDRATSRSTITGTGARWPSPPNCTRSSDCRG